MGVRIVDFNEVTIEEGFGNCAARENEVDEMTQSITR
ncbi:hypothetical protein COMA2_140002 [Candidatus Nitrospira nitrificans]|uniref:Uncharacterized protein n=1 Tax=Candidatus Nitrospira nitrificans TaxID=1742973 RepID=A0A0S4LAH8_9BACT|nr:hypothetical protein COMA2_140002 [Candidatus Nitrospira nitrificans]